VNPIVDLADARLVRALLSGVALSASRLAALYGAMAAKDTAELASLSDGMPSEVRQSLLAVMQLYGDAKVLVEAEKVLPPLPGVRDALQSLKQLADHLEGVNVSFDLADLRGYAYYTGARFAIYAPGASDALARGGRYDEVGAVFGRNRPAAGFSLDLKNLVGTVVPRPLQAAIRAPWRHDSGLSAAIASLRSRGEIVICVLPGHESEVDEFLCDRELIDVAGQWAVQSLN
jgi:ATP phosphoribosyltransferase regulatory subunit